MADAEFVARIRAEGAEQAAEALEQVADAGQAVDDTNAVADVSVEGDTEVIDEASAGLENLDGQSASTEIEVAADTEPIEEVVDLLAEVDGVDAVAATTIEADADEGYAVVALIEDLDGTTSVSVAHVEGDAAAADEVAEKLRALDGVVSTSVVHVEAGSATDSLGNVVNQFKDVESAGVSSWTKVSQVAGQAGGIMADSGLQGAAAMGKAAKGIGAVAAGAIPAAAGAAALTKTLKGSMDAFMGTAEAARQMGLMTGTSTEEMSRWVAVGDDFNIKSQDMAMALVGVTKNLKSDAWTKYGIETKTASGELRSTNDIMVDTIGVLGSIEDPTQRQVVGMQLLGRSYKQLAPMIGSTKEEMEGYLAAVEDGQVITEQEAAKAEEMRVAQDALGDSMMEVKLAVGELVVGLAPLITALAETISVVASVVGPVVDLVSGIGDLGDKIKESIPGFGALRDGIDSLDKPLRKGISALGDWIGGADETEVANEQAAESAQNMAEGFMASGMSIGEAAEAMKAAGMSSTAIKEAMDDAGVSAEELAAAQQETAIQAKAAAAAQEEFVTALEGEVEALEASAEANAAKADAMRGSVDAQFAMTKAQSDYADATASLSEDLEKAGDSQLKQKVVMDELATSADNAAMKQVEFAASTAEAEGATMSAAAKLDMWNGSMLDMARTSTPAASKAIGDYIQAQNGIPDSVRTEITAALRDGDIEGANALLADASKQRDALITADADTAAAEAKVATIEGVAAGTVAVVPVGADPTQFQLQTAEAVAGTPPATILTGADVVPATDAITSTAGAPYDAMIDTEAETRSAQSGIEDVEGAKYQATIDSVAETSAAAGELLDVVTQPRVAEIVALVMGANLARLQLAGLTEPRTAPIAASVTNAGSVNQQLDNLARPRTSQINVNVHQTTTLTRVDGGG